jgi:hypothetical protein
LGAATLTYTQSKTGEKITMPIHADLLVYLNTLAGTDKLEEFLMPKTVNLKSGGRKGLSETFKLIWLIFPCLTSANLCDTSLILKCRAKCDN